MQGGFSIREYASRMRSINVVKCWPFDETSTEETVKSLLPPIVVKRFTWWLDDLQETTQELEISHTKPRKVSEKGETSSRNAATDLGGAAGDGWRATRLKRATKKRSIVELFAVAPAVTGEEEGEEEDDDAAHSVGVRRASKRMKSKDAFLRKALRAVKKIKRKKVEERRRRRRSKENCCKLNLRIRENSSLSCSKEVENDVHGFVSKPKRKPRLQGLGPYSKLVPSESSKMIKENDRHTELPVRGILKNRDKEFSPKKSKKCILHEAIQLNNCSIQKANKHVSFSEDGENLVLIRKSSQAVECLQDDFASDIGDVAVGKYSTNSDTIGSEDACTTREESGPRSTLNVDSATFGKPELGDKYSNGSGNSDEREMYTVNQLWPEHGLEDAPHNAMDVDMPCKEYYNSPNMKVMPTSSYTPCPTFPPQCFEDYLRTHNDASMLNMRRAYELTHAFPENTAANHHPLNFQAFSHVSPNQLHGRNEEFVGLPLNSLGELIALNSCGTTEVHQNMNSNVSGQHIGHHLEYVNLDRRTSSTSQLNLFPVERSYVKENATIAVLPSRLGITESRSEKANLDSDVLEINYHTFHNPEKTKSCDNEKFQSTMRLMGKEFEVGRRGFDNGSVWKDKQIIDEIHFSSSEPSFMPFRETLLSPTDINISKYAHPQSSSTYSGVFLSRTVDCGQKLPRSEVYNTKSLFSEPCLTGYDSQLRNKQNLHCSPIPSIKFPFMHPDFDGTQRSSLIQHPLCFDPSEKAAQLSNHPYVNKSVSFQRDDFSTLGPLQSMATAPLAPVPYYSRLVPVSAMQRQQNRIKSRIGVRGIDTGKKLKASLSNAPFQSFNRSSALGFHEGHQCAVRHIEDATFSSCSAPKSPRFVTTKDGFGQFLPWSDSYIETAGTGPVKSAAGANHVVKHLHQQDHRPADANIGFRFPESENSAQIYQF